MQDALIEPRQSTAAGGASEAHGLQAGAFLILWGNVRAGPLEGAQGRLQAMERAQGIQASDGELSSSSLELKKPADRTPFIRE
jgi:hypothetical protein